ncbi:M13 family metallopeptidase [Mycolicibacterium smegmatis]|uniref:PgPepO oligopeptidase Metallo peptidase MEROPS family M13 n=2 Tax=Mycolicibacterium smegmatis (strain ATCC 700084 / mc(2)155) TaxID=246196 RepID=I7FCS2_MYCS2|nr:M13 family metallopeptidase [Mycolicibacterium smegmatis]ABK69870.1 metallopeptidase [Mycolicibacterium smegmatis MC2 155]AFP36708.1 PgPepO oligopeptidase Metallo peptidase MEROPS family M13 [Mycolicibacterium smegmatis MC2 155]AIU05513.1 peptidase M13 [Mycolicibacterium smegmatis MC2 155]AIU12138.1 peptidase M13 [Mycolicibacterium smegmatis]AIU18762.1 peptidase M13 [Mycolicibacterium smegmatis]
MTVQATRGTADATGKSGIDLTHVDPRTRPQDDLFGHVNGRWLTEYEIPADRATDGAFRLLYDRAEEQIRDLITEAAASGAADGTDEQRIGDLYASFMDTQTIAERGLQPLLDELALIDAAPDADALAAVLGGLQRTGVGGGAGVYVDTDSKNSTRYLLHMGQSGIGLPDESYFRDEQHAEILAGYPVHIAKMFGLIYGGDHTDTAARIVALESKIAAAHWDVVKRRDADLTYNLRRFADLPAEAPGFDWSGWVQGLGTTPDTVAELVVRQPDYLTAFAGLWASEDLEDWKAWARWRVIHARAGLLTDDLVAEDFAFYGRTLSGTEQIRDRWKRAVSVVENLMGDALGKLYVQRHFPPEAKARMDELVANLREAYRVSIDELDWMTPETRAKALAKLDKFTPKIGYPARWRDYSAVVIKRDDLYGNYRRGYIVNSDRELAKLGGPVDRDEWFMTPQTVNAYYNPGMNEIVFPAAILQPPFFDAEADDAANYGGIGAVIGHEIGHGFDDQGAKYDGDGNLVDWWTDADRTEFGARTKALIEQYEQFTPRGLDPSHHVNGAFTVGENIGDLGGLSIALLAYKLSLKGKEAPVIDGLTGVQRVFFGWAQVWRTKSREAEAIRRLAVDPHSPPEFRCNGVVRNIDDFYEAFDVTENDELFLEPERRVRIWN